MPFITIRERLSLARGNDPEIPGQLCYQEYLWMVIAWRRKPLWDTAHEIYREVANRVGINPEKQAARELAWQVFFNLYVMPYAKEQQAKNGDI